MLMLHKPLHLTEYVPAKAVDLTPDEAGSLRRLLPSMSVSPSWDAPGTFDVVPGSEVGVVALDSRVVIVRPKVPADRVLFLLSYALDPVRWQDRQAAYAAETDLVEGMAALYGRELQRALKRGVLQGYRVEEDSLTTLKGRVRFDDQLRRRFGMSAPIEVRFDDYTTDTDLNRLLLTALVRLSRMPIRSRNVRSTLSFCSAVLAEGVSSVDLSPDTIPAITWNRLNQHLRIAADLAELVIRSTSIEVAEGARPGAGLVVDMNQAFEQFLRVALREAIGLTSTSFPEGSKVRAPLDAKGKVRLEPDLSWWQAGRCRFVGDAKYKRISVSGIKHPDLYQLLAYVIALDLPAGLLIYAAGEAESVEHTVPQAGKRLEVTTIDLSGTPSEILGRVNRLAGRVRAIAEQADQVHRSTAHTPPVMTNQ
jgi:5-methylcytosine-specific restriction enzyme subunit McrC